MSVILDKQSDQWTTPAGWGIWADLTPPELLASRRVRGIRRGLLFAFIGLIVLVVLAFGFASFQSRRAASAVSAQQARTAQLQAQELQYGSVTQIKGTVAQVQAQLAQLMVGDVEVAPLLSSLQAVWPRTITITAEQVTLSGAAAAAASAGGTSLDTTDTPQIGKISLTGDAPTLNAFAGYLAALQGVKGMTDVTPGSTGITPTGISFTVTMSITDVLLSHRYDLATSTTPAAGATGATAAGTTPAATPAVSP